MDTDTTSNNGKGKNGKKVIIPIDITDWNEEMLRDENIVTNEDDIFKMLDEGVPMPKIVRAVPTARYTGYAPQDIMRPDKVIYYIGAYSDVLNIIKQRKKTIIAPSGKEYSTPEYIGPVPEKKLPRTVVEDDEAAFLFEAERVAESDNADRNTNFVKSGSTEALARARRYLTSVVLGHIQNRLTQICDAGGDVKIAAEELKCAIDEMVARMV
jgi:hypothetical protein